MTLTNQPIVPGDTRTNRRRIRQAFTASLALIVVTILVTGCSTT